MWLNICETGLRVLDYRVAQSNSAPYTRPFSNCKKSSKIQRLPFSWPGGMVHRQEVLVRAPGPFHRFDLWGLLKVFNSPWENILNKYMIIHDKSTCCHLVCDGDTHPSVFPTCPKFVVRNLIIYIISRLWQENWGPRSLSSTVMDSFMAGFDSRAGSYQHENNGSYRAQSAITAPKKIGNGWVGSNLFL